MREKKLIRRIQMDILIKLSVFLAAFAITFTFVFGVATAPTNDMYPAVHEGDVIVFYRLGSIVNSDVVLYEADGEKNIGRVQALPGSRVSSTKGGLLTIDGDLQPIREEGGIFETTHTREDGKLLLPSAVPEEAFLVLADQRESAKDSRSYGYIEKYKIKGKVFMLIRRRLL